MDWLKELLKNAGIDETKVNEIIASFNKELPKYFIPKDKYNELSEAKKQLEENVKDRDNQLTELAKKAKGNEDLEKQIKELQDTNKNTKAEYEAKIKDLAINSAISSKLSDTKYPELLLTKFDKSKISLADDGTVIGLEEQLKTIKEQYKDLFKPNVSGQDPNNKNKATGAITKEQFNKMSYKERVELYNTNQELYNSLIEE